MTCRMCGSFIKATFNINQLLSWKLITEVALCQSCWAKFTLIDSNCCLQCGRQQTKATVCIDCQRWQSINQKLVNRSLYQYNEQMKAFMKLYKYQYDFELATLFKSSFTKFLRQANATIYVAIPVKHTKRQFNQVIALTQGITFLPLLKLDVSQIDCSQAQRNRYQRMTSKQPFLLDNKLGIQVKNQRVVLVDDIYTTGATVHHAAELIAQCQPSEIIVRTLCR